MALRPDRGKLRTIEKASYVDQRMMESKQWYSRVLLNLQRQFLRYYFVRPPTWKVVVRSKLDKNRMIPSFASLGAVRSGTTLLSDYLMQHPCVVLPLAKEIGVNQYPLYNLIMAQFPTLREKEKIERKYGIAITGYCTPIVPNISFPYLASAVTPQSKIIVIMRNPVERAFAHWKWDQVPLSRVKNDPLWKHIPGFSEIIRLEIENVQKLGSISAFPLSGAGGGYIQHSMYLPFLKVLFTIYDKKEAMFINSSDFFSYPISTVKAVYSFLGLPEYEPVEIPVKNAGPPGKMEDSTKQRLSDFFRPLNEELYDFVGQDFGWQ